MNSWEHMVLCHTVSLLSLSSNSLKRSELAETTAGFRLVLLTHCAAVVVTEAKATKFLQ